MPLSNTSAGNIMETEKDFKELLELFNSHKVDYLIVGGFALAFHGAPRMTGDMDIFVKSDPENAQRIVAALADFGLQSLGFTASDFEKPNVVVQLGVPPVRVDIITSLTGITWEQAVAGKVRGMYGDITVFYIGLSEFVVNKKATGRKRDLADLESLGKN